MKPGWTTKCALIFCCVAWALDVRADIFDLYIAAGQSNMDGRGLSSDLTGALAPYAAPQDDVLLYFTNPRDPVDDQESRLTYTSGDWVSLQPGYAVQPGFSSGDTTLPGTRFGPELSFGRAMADATPDRRVAIVKVSRGSTSISSDWDPSDTPGDPKGFMYHGLEDTLAQAIADLEAQGHSVEIRGVIWHQGSADGVSSYEANHREFIEVLRQDLGNPNIPFIIGELGGETQKRLDLRAIQAHVAATTPYAGFVPSAGLVLQDDQVHFTAAGNIEIGNRFAAQMLQLTSTLAGDYDRSGEVDQADYQVWKSHFGSTTKAQADGNGDGIVDAADYTVWRNNLGSISPPTPPATVKFNLLAAVALNQPGENIGEAISGLDENGIPHTLLMTSTDVQVPDYQVVPGNPSHRTWDGTSYVAGRTQVSTSLGLGIDNPTVTSSHLASEAQNIHPSESWTISFDQDVVFKQIEFMSLGSGDLAQVQVGDLMTVDFAGGSGSNFEDDPFGSLLIPANTAITFTNTAEPILDITSSMSGLSIWRIKGFTVEAHGVSAALLSSATSVPEPASVAVLLGASLAGLAALKRRRA